ncbi:MAG: flagellar hook capping FlgD N-terminal domain-containing protein [Devosia indica]|uniref:flagellar hook assembly protein FlgD n=1 Tax=Devosia TaxID=46913 RepID=UPI000CE9AC28|nr:MULTISPECIES: flagellar hook assembly protein FlgD [Devosia]AVF04198.1 flagellar hook capping protein [Devosia sp. I507]
MAVDSVSPSSSNGAVSSSRSTIAGNFDTFLSILTTQLKNQNPLDPLDTNQFTAQLVQFSGVEQQLQTNEFLEALLLNTQTSYRADAVSYIGKQVSASGETAELVDGGAYWAYNAEANVANATVSIKDAAGNVVYTETGSLNSGPGAFLWDGVGSDGNTKPDGIYTIEIKGTNLAGNEVKVSTSSVGIVTGVDFSGSEPMLTVGKNKVALSDVTDIQLVSETPAEDGEGDEDSDTETET